MPPFVGRKRARSASPSTPPNARKPTLFDTADKPTASSTVKDSKAFLDSLGGSDSESSLSDVSSSGFEDVVPAAKKRKTEHEDDDEEVDWEDAIQEGDSTLTHTPIPERPLGDLELTLDKGARPSMAESYGKKKGPSKIERQIRIATHCIHVQFLLFHNLVRNGWTCDKEVQSTLVGQLPPNIKSEIDRWKIASGMDVEVPSAKPPQLKKGGKGGRGGGKAADNIRSQREWGKPAERQEKGAPNMSSGDPIMRLLRLLASYWKKRFAITEPTLRKQGYKSLAQLEAEISSFKKDKHDPEEHGERVNGIADFRKIAQTYEGSRDVGEQLFVALIRGVGIEARLVASLQPVGFGWNKNEEATIKKKKTGVKKSSPGGSDDESDSDIMETAKPTKPAGKAKKKVSKSSRKGKAEAPIDLSEESASEDEGLVDDDDDESVVDVTPSTPRRKPNKNYDKDMSFPTYWVEVVSPITNEVYPVEPFLVSRPVTNTPEYLACFEPRGSKADKAKVVLSYVVAYDAQGCAKEVTTRYLKRHMWPGRTKGVRMPVEKVPIYNKRGKIKHHEELDWFKTVISGYQRPDHLRTAVDDLEEAKDLKAVKPEKREKQHGEDTLQGYKTSADFVLERHLRREEALRPGAKPVKYFTAGKGEKATEEPVFRRKDAIICRTGESWHKAGLQVKAGEHPVKMVPVRAVTLTRKREVEEAERQGGEKLKQGMYSEDQTEYIVPPPIEDGIIPRNAYGNIDCFVPSMVPKGAVHIPLRKTMAVCKRLGISFAEAVTGFEFGNKRAVPVVTGVIVATENEDLVIDEWEKDEEERRRKEDAKREKIALGTWRKFLMGLRIVERMKAEYGGDAHSHLKEEMNPFTNQKKLKKQKEQPQEETRPDDKVSKYEDEDEDMAGGFLVDDADDADDGDAPGGGFFPDGDEDMEDSAYATGGGFLADGDDEEKLAPTDELVIDHGDAAPRRSFKPALEASEEPKPASTNARKTTDAMDIDTEEPPPTKKRGRPRGSTSKTPKTPKTKPPKKGANAVTPNTQHKASESEDDVSASKTSGNSKAPPKAATNAQANGHQYSSESESGPAIRTSPRKELAKKASTRKTARQSATAVKSHYFRHDSDDEDNSGSEEAESSDDDDEVDFEPEVKRKKAGRPAGKAQKGRKTK